MYLNERNIRFTPIYVDLQENVNLSRWYLRINPRGEVPSMSLTVKMDETDDDEEAKDAKKIVITDSTKIIHTLESKYISTDEGYLPCLVPSSSDTEGYQEYIYYTAFLTSYVPFFLVRLSFGKIEYSSKTPDVIFCNIPN